jgi:hypothetical protein
MERYNYKTIFTAFAAMLLLGITACRKMDDYKDKYLGSGEISYAGKLDSAAIYSGDGRVIVHGLLIADPKIKQIKVFWNFRKDSLVIPVVRTSGIDTINAELKNMVEGVFSFEIVTYSDRGDKSVTVNVSGRAYGEQYKKALLNRSVSLPEMNTTPGNVTLDWGKVDASGGMLGTQLTYPDANNVTRSIFVRADSLSVVLNNAKPNGIISYRSLYKPDSLCVDTFYTAYNTMEIKVKTDVTALYMKNTTSPIQRGVWDGSRWGVPADWEVNTDVKNTTGTTKYGGYELRGGLGQISMEAGWGLPDVPNGKIYQALTLPAGKYIFEIDLGDNGGGTPYIVAATGTTLPDVANVPGQSLAFSDLPSKKLAFEVKQAGSIALGFAANLKNTGQYLKIKSVKLFSYR